MTDEPRPDHADDRTGQERPHDGPAGSAPASDLPEGASSTPGVPPLPPTAFPGAPSQSPAAPQPYGSQPYGSQPSGAQPFGAQPSGAQPYGAQPSGAQPYGAQPHGSQPYGSQPYGAQPVGTQQGPPWASAPPQAGPRTLLSTLSLVAGIAGLATVLFTLGATILLAIAAVVLGHLASSREPHARGRWLGGLVTGYVGVLAAICLWVGLLAFSIAFASTSAGGSFGW